MALDRARRLVVAEGEERIAEQLASIVKLRENDADTTIAARILDELKSMQRAVLDQLAAEESAVLAQFGGTETNGPPR